VPMNGHTPSVSVSGSDEKRAKQRQPRRRRVRRRWCSLAAELLSSDFTTWQRQRGAKTGCAQLL